MRTLSGSLCAAMLALALVGCFEQEEPTCAYWVPKMLSPAKGEKALKMVEELRCVDGIATLEQMFDDGQGREEVLRSLTLIGNREKATPILRKALMTRDAGKLAASIVGDWRLVAARGELHRILTTDVLPRHRKEALAALLSFEKARNIESLLITLAGNDPSVQGIHVNRIAVEQLGNLASPRAVPVLLRALFLKDARGAKIYQAARLALVKAGAPAVEALGKTLLGDNKELEEYAQANGIMPWEWQLGPEVTQVAGDTLNVKIAPAMLTNMERELTPPLGVSEAMSERWRIGQINRLKVAMLGLGRMGPVAVIDRLGKLAGDVLKDARNQRLNAATTLAFLGTDKAQDTLLALYKAEDDANFRAPLLQPIVLGLSYDRLPAFQKLTAKASARVAEGLKVPKVIAYLAVLNECKDDAGCYLQKLKSEKILSSDEAVATLAKYQAEKAAVRLASGIGDRSAVLPALLKYFVNTPPKYIDLRHFMLIAITRLGDAATGEELLKMAENAEKSDRFWPGELRVYGHALKHRR